MADINSTTQSGANSLYKVATGSTGAGGEAVYDVFSGSEHIADPADARLKGVDIKTLPDGTTPTDFKSQFLPAVSSGLVGGSDRIQAQMNDMNTQIKNGLAQYSITPPETDITKIMGPMNDILKSYQDTLKDRNTQDTANIDKSFQNQEEQLKISQDEQVAQAEGRTRIGGFFTQLEAQDILKMKRQFDLDMSSLKGQHQQALQTANRAYEDGNFNLAKEQLQNAKDAEAQINQRQQAYFQDVQAYNQMSTPVKAMKDAQLQTITGLIQKYPDAFADVLNDPAKMLDMTGQEVMHRVMGSDSYKRELSQGKAPDTIGSASTGFYSWNSKTGKWDKVVGAAPTTAAGGSGSIGGQNVSASTLNVIDGSRSLSDYTTSERTDIEADLRKIGFFSATVPAWFKTEANTHANMSLTPDALSKLWEATRKKITSYSSKSSSSSAAGSPPWLTPK